jgi:fibronectin type 3 domain-containing protein
MVDENVFDHNGWSETVANAGANQYSHNAYVQDDNKAGGMFRGNVFARGAAHGLQARSGGIVDRNVFVLNAVEMNMGSSPDPTDPNIFTFPNSVTKNVMIEGRLMGLDTAWPRSAAVWGILAPGTLSGIVCDDNIIANRRDSGVNYALAGTVTNLVLTNNIIRNWEPARDMTDATWPHPDDNLGNFYATIGGTNSETDYLAYLRNRPVHSLPWNMTAYAALNYLRAGFNKAPVDGLFNYTGAPPTGLTATAGTAQVALSWTASSGATSYNVKGSTVSGSGYVTVASPTTASYTNTALTNGTTYYYVVSAVHSVGESANSAQVSATPDIVPAPTGLTATTGNAQVALSWTASSGATSYNVKRSTVSGSGYVSVASQTTTASFTNTALTNGTTYYYVVSAVNAVGESANSAQVSATPSIPVGPAGYTYVADERQSYTFTTTVDLAFGANGSFNYLFSRTGTITFDTATFGDPIPGTAKYGFYKVSSPTIPAAPTGLTATAGNAQVALSWTASSGATSYNVKRSTVSGSGYVSVASPTTASYTNTALTNGTTYYYVVSAVNSVGESANSAQVSATSTPIGPAGYTYVTNEGQSYTFTTTVDLAYGANGSFNYLFSRTGTITFNNATFGDPILGTAKYGFYKVSSPTIPAAPTGLAATAGTAQVALSWTASSGATSYNVKRSTVSGSGYVSVASPTTASYTNTALTNGTTYYYVVSAVNSVGESANSAQVSATPSIPVGPAGYTYVADEGQSYTFTTTVDLAYGAYGANGSFNYLFSRTGTITFNNATFGDPILGTKKFGFYK